jgi:hypothetical protein
MRIFSYKETSHSLGPFRNYYHRIEKIKKTKAKLPGIYSLLTKKLPKAYGINTYPGIITLLYSVSFWLSAPG